MEIDWTLFARYAAPILALFVGAALNHFLAKRPKLISYLTHASAVTVHPPEGPQTQVNTHSIVVRNAGSKAANNVRVGHHVLPDFSVYPSVRYEVVDLPGGGHEIVFPVLVQGEQVTITYLYFPPVLWSNVNSNTKSDEGFARIVTVLPTPRPPRWLFYLRWVLIILGCITAAFAVGQGVMYVVHRAL